MCSVISHAGRSWDYVLQHTHCHLIRFAMILPRILSWWKHIQAFLEPKVTSKASSWGAEGGGGLSHVQNWQRSKQWSLSGKFVAQNYVTLYTRGFPIHAAFHILYSTQTKESGNEASYSTYTSSTEPSTLSALLTPDLRGSGSMMVHGSHRPLLHPIHSQIAHRSL